VSEIWNRIRTCINRAFTGRPGFDVLKEHLTLLFYFNLGGGLILNPGPGCPPNTAHIVCLPNQTHLIELVSSLEETPGPDMDVSDKRDCAVLGGDQGRETLP